MVLRFMMKLGISERDEKGITNVGKSRTGTKATLKNCWLET
jgi:hypothetical protein